MKSDREEMIMRQDNPGYCPSASRRTAMTGILAFSLIALSYAQKGAPRRSVSIIPKPLKIQLASGEFRLAPSLSIEADPGDPAAMAVGEQLAGKLRRATSLPVQIPGVSGKVGKNPIRLRLRQDLSRLGAEGYLLSASKRAVSIEAFGPAGLFYGVQTLYQLLPAGIESAAPSDGRNWTIPCVKIEDQPRFGWRGVHLDVCLHFYPDEFIKKYLDILTMYKMNVFHWHLTEDQGWRLEIKKYPALTQAGAWRRETTYDGKPYGGFYTQAEVCEVVEYAKRRFITVVPEIEMPGHCLSALAAYPELSCSGGPFEVETDWGIFSDVFCAGSERTFEFLQDVLTEVFDLFPAQFVHIGGDEVPKTRWKNCARCQARIKAEGLADEKELQSYFIKRIEKFVNGHGKRIIGWDEILEGGLAPNAAVMSWRGIAGGVEAARLGHDVVMTPTSHCYFDYDQAKADEPEAFPAYLPIGTVYSYEPIPAEFTPQEAGHILGAQASVWTEYMPDSAQVEYMLLPRMLALSEVVWTKKELRGYRDFSERLIPHYDRLAARGINFRLPPPEGLDGQRVVTNPITLTITSPYPGAEIRYTMNGAEPTRESAVLTQPSITVSASALVQARTFLPGGRASRTASLSVSLVDPKQNGVSYSYYEGNWYVLPDFRALTPLKEGTALGISLEPRQGRPENFGLEFRGFIRIPVPGEYTFWLQADDGAGLAINGRDVVRNNGAFRISEVAGRIHLDAGKWPFALSYFQKSGNSRLRILVQGPGMVRQVLPADWLFQK
jgi:hexosaminidase